MARVQRVGDQDSAGRRIGSGVNSVRINNIPVAVVNAPVTSHPNNEPPHTNAKTQANKNTTVRVANQLVVVAGDPDTCGHVRVGGSPDVNIG